MRGLAAIASMPVRYNDMNNHRKYNFLKSELEDFLTSFISRLDITNPSDKAIYDHLCAAIESAADTASREKDQYDNND